LKKINPGFPVKLGMTEDGAGMTGMVRE
jgi:hypothetical protein